MTTIPLNLPEYGWRGQLTVEQVNQATREMLEEKNKFGYTIIYCASKSCSIEVVEAIIDKGVDINALSFVRII
jgi:ankyrin repeat protein